MKTRLKIIIALVLLVTVAAFYMFGGTGIFNVTALKNQQPHLTQLFNGQPFIFGGLFFVLCRDHGIVITDRGFNDFTGRCYFLLYQRLVAGILCQFNRGDAGVFNVAVYLRC